MAPAYTADRQQLTRLQRWSSYLTLGCALAALVLGIVLRNRALNATTFYTNPRAGISARYPANWLIDDAGDYVFRVRDMARIGFKTTIQVALRPVGAGTTPQNVLTSLSLVRSSTLATYRILSIEDYQLPDDSPAVQMRYYFAATEPNPFLESLPAVVLGIDILTLRRGQAVIITFRADAATFEEDLRIFNRFLNSLEFE